LQFFKIVLIIFEFVIGTRMWLWSTKRKESIPGVLSTGNGMETTILLKLDNLSDRLVLNGLQFFSISLASSDSITLLHKLIRTKQRANVLGSEGWASLCGRHVV
jgi:hypothetical protein